MFGSGFNVQKLKANAKMAVHRISLVRGAELGLGISCDLVVALRLTLVAPPSWSARQLSNKKKNLVENQKREIAAMLREAKDEKARIRVCALGTGTMAHRLTAAARAGGEHHSG